jgi:hypothetical protein
VLVEPIPVSFSLQVNDAAQSTARRSNPNQTGRFTGRTPHLQAYWDIRVSPYFGKLTILLDRIPTSSDSELGHYLFSSFFQRQSSDDIRVQFYFRPSILKPSYIHAMTGPEHSTFEPRFGGPLKPPHFLLHGSMWPISSIVLGCWPGFREG